MADKHYKLKRYDHSSGEIMAGYALLAPTYAETMARLRTLQFNAENPRRFSAQKIKREIAQGPVKSVTVDVGQPIPMGINVNQLVASIAFVTQSDRYAIDTITRLGHPEEGAVWEEVSIIANQDKKNIKVSGKLRLLVIEAAE